MTRWTFAKVKEVFTTDDVVRRFRCIAKGRGGLKSPNNTKSPDHLQSSDASVDCPNYLEDFQIHDANRFFREAHKDTHLDEVRDIINCLLCEECQRGSSGYKRKDAVEDVWKIEFPNLDFSLPRKRSDFSLVNQARERSRRSSAVTSRAHSRTSMRSQEVDCSGPSEPPIPFTGFKQDSASELSVICSSMDRLGLDSPATPSRDYYDAAEFFDDKSPLAGKGPKVTIEVCSDAQSCTATAGHDALLQPEATMNGRSADEIHAERNATPPSEPAVTQAHLVIDGCLLQEQANNPAPSRSVAAPMGRETANSTPQRSNETSKVEQVDVCIDFSPYTPSHKPTRAPWMLRSQVLSILLKPLPSSKGSLYACPVRNSSYVKIGLTMRDVYTRLCEIRLEHEQDLVLEKAFCLSDIPEVYLRRLEKLIFADLVYYRRRLKARRGTIKDHNEYFEIELPAAERTINMWWRIMQVTGMQPGCEVDLSVSRAIYASSTSAIEPFEGWAIMTESSHERREQIWSRIFKLEEGGLGHNERIHHSTSANAPSDQTD